MKKTIIEEYNDAGKLIKKTTVEELGLYMAGAKRMAKEEAAV